MAASDGTAQRTGQRDEASAKSSSCDMVVSPPFSPEYKTVIALTQNTTSAASTDRQIMSDFLFIRYSSFASCITCRVFVYVTTYNKLRDYLRQVTVPQLTKIHINYFNVKNTSNQYSIWKLFSGLKDNYSTFPTILATKRRMNQ